MYEGLALYIDGEFIAGGGRREQDVHNPASGEAIGRLPHASTEDLDRALAAAQRAFETWRSVSPMEKSRILRKVGELTRERAQAIATNITLDQGKPLAEATGEVTRCADHCDWHAEECRRIYGRVIPPRSPNCCGTICGTISPFQPVEAHHFPLRAPVSPWPWRVRIPR